MVGQNDSSMGKIYGEIKYTEKLRFLANYSQNQVLLLSSSPKAMASKIKEHWWEKRVRKNITMVKTA